MELVLEQRRKEIDNDCKEHLLNIVDKNINQKEFRDNINRLSNNNFLLEKENLVYFSKMSNDINLEIKKCEKLISEFDINNMEVKK